MDDTIAVLEGRIESLAEAADVLTGAADSGIGAFAATFRDPRDVLALPLLRDGAAEVAAIAEADYPARLAAATRLLRLRADRSLVQVEPLPAARARGARIRLTVVAAAAPGERRDHVLSRLAGAILCDHARPLVVSGLADLAERVGPVRTVAPAALAASLAEDGAGWVLALPAGCGVTPALAELVGALDTVGDAVTVIQPAVALAPGSRLAGVYAHETGIALVRSSALAGRTLDSFAALQRAVRSAAARAPASACLRLEASASPALLRERIAKVSDAALRRIVVDRDADAAARALVRRIVLDSIARTGDPARAIAETLPESLERLREWAEEKGLSPDVLHAATVLAGGGAPFRAILSADGDGLLFRPELAWDIEDYVKRNPDLALRRVQGEAIDPVDHLLDEGAIEGRQIRRRQIPLVSFAADAAERAALPRWTRPDDRRLAANVRSARSTRLVRALEAEGRFAAAAARAARIGDGPALRFALTRCGHAALVLRHLERQGIAQMPAVEIAFIFDWLLPRPDLPGDEPAFVAAAYQNRPKEAGMRAVDHAIRAGRYALAAERLKGLRKRIDLPTHEVLPRLHDLCDWAEFVRLAGDGSRPKREAFRDRFFGLLNMGRMREADALVASSAPSPAQAAWHAGIRKFLTGDFHGSHEDFQRSVRLGSQPHFFHILAAQHQKLGQDAEAAKLFALWSLVDRELAGSALPAARFFERHGGAREGVAILARALARHAGPFWRIQAALFVLFHLACFMRRHDLATRIARCFAAHPSAGAALHEHERKQLGISFSLFAPRLAPLFKAPPDSVGTLAIAPADADPLDDLKALFTAQVDTAFLFTAFQPGDTYLFLYAAADFVARLRAQRGVRRVVVVSSRKVSKVAALFGHLFDELVIRDVPDFYVLKRMVAELGVEDRVVIGHFEFLEYDHLGRFAPAERLVSHYVPSIRGPLGLPLDHAGVHPAPTVRSPIEKGEKPRAFVVPMANSMPLLPAALWARVVERLSAEGYEVFINRGPNEETLGTGAAEFGEGYAETLAFAHSCDVIVGLRSGLLDICSGSPARLVEVYNSQVFVGPFLYIWELEKLRPGRETRVVRVLEHLTPHDEIVARIVAAALGRPDPGDSVTGWASQAIRREANRLSRPQVERRTADPRQIGRGGPRPAS